MARALNIAGLERAAIRHLQRFPCSEDRLRWVLRRRIHRAQAKGQIDEAQAQALGAGLDEVALKMRRFGLIDDVAYARALVGSLHRRGKSRRAMSAKLRERMVPAEVAEPAIQTLYEALSEDQGDPELMAAIRYARRRRLGPWSYKERDQDTRRRALASLGRQGFSYVVAAQVIDGDREALEARLP